MKTLGTILIGLGILAVLVGAGTSDLRIDIGVPTPVDGLVLGVIGLVLFSVGAAILAEQEYENE